MVIDKTFAKHFEEQREEYEGIRRIVSVNYVKALAEQCHQRQREARGHRVHVFPEVGEESMSRGRRGIAVDMDAIDDLPRRLALSRGTDHRHEIACGAQRVGLAAHTNILGKRQVFQQHEDSVFGDCRHVFFRGHLRNFRPGFKQAAQQTTLPHAPGARANP